MPVDFIKARLLNVDIPKLISDKRFKQKSETYIDKDEGECSKLILEYKNLTITIIKNKIVILTGSIHYFYNDGIHNYNNFTFTNLINTLDEVANLLEIELYHFRLQNIEFGVNLKLPYNVTNITNNLLTHNQKEFLKPYNFDYKVTKHQRYWVKVYNKGKHFNRPDNILRVELKYKKMIDLNKIGLHTLKDLQNKDLHHQLLAILLEQWSKVLLYDFTINKSQLRPLYKSKSLEYQNQNFWLNLTSQERNRQKKSLQTLSLEYGANTHHQISNLIENQYKSLMI
ncbi:hypothetical protein KO506_03900 [Polaribacter vadi]|uniref:hypothetical protein n=1 Tax=Polaribacter TaxID=52959 RepID=UPI001C0A384A|nr:MULTISPECIES: hypothetical protein [Polaribacter]MBU3010532.1 hypothetical protein [Polaribacter vadi]MDO6740342.1 hypothetical protein [Polaribacter sp. 1_MG-2023]